MNLMKSPIYDIMRQNHKIKRQKDVLKSQSHEIKSQNYENVALNNQKYDIKSSYYEIISVYSDTASGSDTDLEDHSYGGRTTVNTYKTFFNVERIKQKLPM